MNTREAKALLAEQLRSWRTRGYSELSSLLGSVSHSEVTGESGVRYQIEIEPFWDDKSAQTIRVLGSIDDGGVRAFVPLCDDFIAPDGSFVDEEAG